MNIGKETEVLEFKKSTSELKEAIISISSILNKHQKGTLYFGVKDNGDVCGQEIGKDTLRFLSRDLSGFIKPSFWYEINVQNSDDGKTFIEVQFKGENVPYSAYGRYYQRFADEDKLIARDELEILFKAKRKDYSQWEETDSDIDLNDINEDLLKQAIKSGNENYRINYAYSDKESILTKLGLINRKSGCINNAGKVLFSKSGPVLLKLATFASETKDTFIKLNHFEGNVYECINQAMEYISKNIDWNVILDGSAKRKEIPEIPLLAIREIVINAFCHGCYDANTTFQIEIFKDKVSIYSPGFFPLGYTPDDFASGKEEPVMLNPKIINVLFKTGEIESFGSGFERTFKVCDDNQVSYYFENTKSGFKFVFYRPLGHRNAQEKMSKTDQDVYECIKENNNYTTSEIASKLSKSSKTIYRSIKKLKERGFIRRIGNDYNGHWEVN